MNRALIRIALVVLLAASPALAAELRVPADFTTIQAAVDAASTGDTVLVSKGDYPEVVVLDRKPGITIRGEGGPVVTRFSLLRSYDVQLRGLVVQGSQAGSAIYLFGSSRVRIRKCVIRDTAGSGIVTEGGSETEIEKNTFESIGATAISLGHTGQYSTSHARVRKNRMSDIGGHGVHLRRADGSLVEKNTVLGCGGVGYYVEEGNDNVLRKNRVEDSDLDGFAVQTSRNTLDENLSMRAVGDAFHVAGDANRVVDNEAVDTEEAGYQIAGTGGHFEGNRASGCRLDGFSVSGSDHVLRKNKVRDVGGCGFRVESQRGQFEKNKVKEAGEDGFRVTGVANVFQRNSAKKAGNGFYVLGGGCTFERNKASRSREFDLWRIAEAVVHLVDNDFGSRYVARPVDFDEE